MLRTLLAGLALACVPVAARAGLDAETSEAYQYKIVLHFGNNRLLTPVFRQRVAAELHDWFEGALGDKARVTVTETHPLLPEIESRGLEQALDGVIQPLKGWRPVNPEKCHFVLIDYVDGQYQIQARQQDGFTGLASPVVRVERTTDRSFVARTAARLMEHDFGAAGTIQPGASGSLEGGSHSLEVTVALKASALGESKDRLVKAGDIFAIARIFTSQGRLGSYRVPWALVQVSEDPHDGVCHCRLYSRLQDPLAMNSTTLGYRCLKLGTITAPLRMRLVNDQNLGPLTFSVRAKVSQQGFNAERQEELTPSDEDGLIKTNPDKPYTDIAFVTVLDRTDTRLALIPVEIVGNRIITCPISADYSGPLAELTVRHRRLINQAQTALALSTERFGEIAKLVKDDEKQKALETTKTAIDELEKDLSEHKIDLAALTQAIQTAKMEQSVSVDDAKAQTDQIQQRLKDLHDFIAKLTGVENQEKNPDRAKWAEKVDRAHFLEKTADYAEAIKLYEQVLQQLPEGGPKPDLQNHYNELKRIWDKQDQNAQLAKARKFIYETWPKLDSVAALSKNLPELREAFTACKDAGDYLTPQKLLLTFAKKADLLNSRQELLRQGSGGEDAIAENEEIGKLSHSLGELQDAVVKYIKEMVPAPVK
jgi:hypothetical protein